jgi:hypothetical protein
MESDPASQCHHIKTSGVRCGSPALRDRRYCYYHQRQRPVMVDLGDEDKPLIVPWPVLEDAHSVQFAIRNVAIRLLDGTIGPKTAGLLFYALQIASSNLKQMKPETPQPEQVVVDPPKLSEIPRQAPAAEPVRLNSHTTRLTHYPGPPSMEDDYHDDVMRQARELREELAFPIHDDEGKSKGKQEKASKTSDNSAPNDGLPPGTIQACVSTPRREKRRARYVN